MKQKGGVLTLINLVDMEDYLKSVVPSESYSSWPLDTPRPRQSPRAPMPITKLLHRED